MSSEDSRPGGAKPPPPANDPAPARGEGTTLTDEMLTSLLARAMAAEQRVAELEMESQRGHGEAASHARVMAAEARVVEVEEEMSKLREQTLRALAEAENTRRRLGRELEEGLKYAVANFAREIVAVGDNLRRALDTLTQEARAADPKLEQFAQGVELTEREFITILERHGIQRVAAIGQPFDPSLHQAIAQLETTEHAPGTVMQVVQAGFTLHGRILRPALVVVAKAAAGDAPPPGTAVDTTA
jgi:molecular chaperone GrpE